MLPVVPPVADSDPKKTAPLPWLLLTGLLGVFAVGVPQATTPSAAPAKKDEKKEGEPPAVTVPVEDPYLPLKPVLDFHRSHEYGTLTSADELRQQVHGYKTEFLIATVPDPIDTPYGYAFDQAVDAVQRAVEKKDGYILDRAWLPWEVDRKAKPKPGEPPSDLHVRKPGVLLFRHGRDRSKKVDTPGLCVVFLVGETPMGGVHKRAFYQALRMITAVGHPEAEPVRVVGPYFSGSQTSLQFVIGDWWAKTDSTSIYSFDPHPAYRFQVVTGNATAVRKSEFFGYEGNKETFPSWRKDGVTFASTVVPTRTTLGAMLHFLSRRDGSATREPLPWGVDRLPGKVAVLTESNTAFGKAFNDVKLDQLITLRFPLHISRVKNEYNSAAKE
jgi:hypothetical protein